MVFSITIMLYLGWHLGWQKCQLVEFHWTRCRPIISYTFLCQQRCQIHLTIKLNSFHKMPYESIKLVAFSFLTLLVNILSPMHMQQKSSLQSTMREIHFTIFPDIWINVTSPLLIYHVWIDLVPEYGGSNTHCIHTLQLIAHLI